MDKILTIDKQMLITQVTGNVVSDMDGEKVMFSITNGKYYNLGETGGEIWNLLNEPKTVEQIVTTLLSQYEVDQETCEEQVTSFLNMLAEEKLIRTN